MKQSPVTPHSSDARHDTVFHRVAGIVEAAKLSAARSVNSYIDWGILDDRPRHRRVRAVG